MELLILGLAFIILGSPWILTLLNIINLFNKNKILENAVDVATFVLGILFTILLYGLNEYKPYSEQLSIAYGEVG